MTENVFDYTEQQFVDGTAFADFHGKYYGSANYKARKPGFIRNAQRFGLDAKEVRKALDELAQDEVRKNNSLKMGVVEYSDWAVPLQCGEWTATDNGVYRNTIHGQECACAVPIVVSAELVNIDSTPGNHMTELAFRDQRSGAWNKLIVPNETISTSSKIVALANRGVPVTQKSAAPLVDFLACLKQRNAHEIPLRKSTAILGDHGAHGFAPYAASLEFDGEAAFGSLYHSVTPHGSLAEWVECANQCRQESVEARIMIAASFASAINHHIGLPCFVHLWSGQSGNGKSMLLRLAASVWANPTDTGDFIKTFDATQVGLERTAACLNHLPLCLDELQLAKGRYGIATYDPYKLAEGVGRLRGEKFGGVDNVLRWNNIIISTGESELVQDNAGAGASNRVIQIHTERNPIVGGSDIGLTGIYNRIATNYGTAGERFVKTFYGEDHDTYLKFALDIRDDFQSKLSGRVTGKQALAATALLVGDALARYIVLGQESPGLTIDDLMPYLLTDNDVSIGRKGYLFLQEWISSNSARHFIQPFTDSAGKTVPVQPEASMEVFGKLEGDIAYIIPRSFRNIMQEGGFSHSAVLSWMKQNKFLVISNKQKSPTTHTRQLNGRATDVYAIKLCGFED